MIDGKNIFDQLIRNNSQKIVTGQEYDYTIICLLDQSWTKKLLLNDSNRFK